MRGCCAVALFVSIASMACDVTWTPLLDGSSAAASKTDGIDPREPNVERTTKALSFDDVATLRVDIPFGRVTIVQQADVAASIKVTETVLLTGRTRRELEELLTGSQVTAERSFVDPARLEVEAEIAEGLRNSEISFEVEIVIPRGVPMQIVLDGGPVNIRGVQANIEVTTHVGAITMQNVAGRVIARTDGAPIDISDSIGSIEATTSDADVSIRASIPADGSVLGRTSNGDVSLSIPTSTAAALRLDAPGGSVSANLTGFSVTDLSVTGQSLRGTLNGGGGQIDGQTEGGDVVFIGI